MLFIIHSHRRAGVKMQFSIIQNHRIMSICFIICNTDRKSWFPKPFILKVLTQWQLWQLPQNPWFLLAKARLKNKLQMSCVEILSSSWDLFKAGRRNTDLPGSMEDVVLSHMTKSWGPGICLSFPWNPKCEWCHRSLQCLCRFLPCSQLGPSSDWDISCSRDRDNPQGRWGTLGGWKSLPKHKTNLMLYSPLQWLLCIFPNDYCTSSSDTMQSGKTQRLTAFVNKY